jgi:hypothetical protein
MLVSVKSDRATAPLHEAVRVGRAAGLGIAEMQRMSGYTRPTIYAALRAIDDRPPASLDPTLLTRQVLVVLGSTKGVIPLSEVAHRLRLQPAPVHGALLSLAAQGLCHLGCATGRDRASLSALATPLGRDTLRAIFDDLFLRRPDGFSAYLRVDESEQRLIQQAASGAMSHHEHTVIEASVAPSRMTGPELVLSIHAPSSRVALQIAHDIWNEMRERAGLAPVAARIMDLIPPSPLPCGESAVLDVFAAAVAETAPTSATAVMQARMRYAGGSDERALACRCVTAAARVLRRTVGQEHDPRPISNADAAWGELAPVRGIHVGIDQAPVKRATQSALEIAADRLGPFRGGELGSHKEPGKPPVVVEEIKPSASDLESMARHAGAAVGAAASLGAADGGAEMLAVVAPARAADMWLPSAARPVS